jgi:predicted RNA-binding Zn ribbon-like protein
MLLTVDGIYYRENISRLPRPFSMRGMSTTPAPGESARPALALVNSRRNDADGPVDDLATPADLGTWLADQGLVPPTRVNVAALAAVQELRDAVRELLLARIAERAPAHTAVEIINAAAAAAPTAPRLVWRDPGAPRAEPHCLGAGGVPLARSLLAADAIDLITGPAHVDLLACAAPGCVRLLLRDHPRRRWCSTRCGDRVRASRYYHRHRETAR